MNKSRVLLSVLLVFGFCVSSFSQEEAQQVSRALQKNKISLDIKGMDIVDVLKTLALRARLNVVVGKNVAGRATFFLKDVDVYDAFEIILLANDLAYEKKAGIINVMTQRDYELLYGESFQDKKQVKIIQLKYAKAANLLNSLNQLKTNMARVVADESSNTIVLMDSPARIKEMEDFIKGIDLLVETRVFSLNYAQADKISEKLKEALTKGVGCIKTDERTNKILITDFPKKLDELAKDISAFDEKTQQVLISAQIIEIRPKDEFKMGVDWDFWLKKNVRLMSSLPTTTSILNKLSIGTAARGASVTGKEDYKGVVDLLRTLGDTQILSSPRITALNNQEAKILVGTKEPYATSSISQSSGSEVTAYAINFVDVGIKLYVTPTINRDGFITMKIKPEISSVSNNYSYGPANARNDVPIVETSEAETSVMVKERTTIIIGGLKKDSRIKEVNKVPILGDIPLIGFLFRKTSDSLTKTELVILLTPYILSGEVSLTDFSDLKPNEGAIVKMFEGNIVMQKMKEALQSASSRLDAKKDKVLAYYELVTDKVKSANVSSDAGGEKGAVDISFILTRNGQFKNEPKIVSSNNQKLNDIVIKRIKNISSFPAFPADLNKEEENFRITLVYK